MTAHHSTSDAPALSKTMRRILWAAALLAALALWHWMKPNRPDRKEPRDGGRGTGTAATFQGRRLRAFPRIPPPPRIPKIDVQGIVLDPSGEAVSWAGVRMSGLTEGTTEAGRDGRFLFRDVPAGVSYFQAWSDRAASLPVKVRVFPGMGEVTLVVGPAARLLVRVIEEATESPIPNADVVVTTLPLYGQGAVASGTTNQDGELELAGLAPGSYRLFAKAEGHGHRDVILHPQAGLDWEATIRLPKGARVFGEVLDRSGAPVEGAVVRRFPAGLDLIYITRPPQDPFAVTTDRDGRFVMEGIPAGRHLVQAYHPLFEPGWSQSFDSNGRDDVSGIVIHLDPGGRVSGIVVDASGRPVPFAQVRINATDTSAKGAGLRVTKTDERGLFEFGGLPRSEVQLMAQSDESVSEAVTVDLSKKSEVERIVVELVDDLTISGRVTEPDGQTPIPYATVMCMGSPRSRAVAIHQVTPETTDEEGRFTCRGLAPGEYGITAMRPFPNNNQSPWMRSVTVMAYAGEQDVVVAIPEDGSLSGRVILPDGSPAKEFAVGIDPGGEPRPFSSPDGGFVLDGIAPKSYHVRVFVQGKPPLTVTARVEPGKRTDLGDIRFP